MSRPDDDLDLVAAELAFGLLDADARAAAQARLVDPDFEARHRLWSSRAAAVALATPSVAPMQDLRPAVSGPMQPDRASSRRPALRFWQALSGLAAAAAIILAILLAQETSRPPRLVTRTVLVSPPLIAVLTAPEGTAAVAVAVDRRKGTLALTPARFTSGGRAAELWVIPAGGKPASLGIMPSDRRGQAIATAAVRPALVPGATLAISLEPQGGSPTGQPTGPVVLSGKIVAA